MGEGSKASPGRGTGQPLSANLLAAAAMAVPVLVAGGAGTALLTGGGEPKVPPGLWEKEGTVTQGTTIWRHSICAPTFRDHCRQVPETRRTAAEKPGLAGVREQAGKASVWLRLPATAPALAVRMAVPGLLAKIDDWTITLPLRKPDLLPHRPVPVLIGYRLANRSGWINARITVTAYDGCLDGRPGRSCERWTEPLGAIEREDDMLIWVPAEHIIADGALRLHLRLSIEARVPDETSRRVPPSTAILAIDRVDIGQP